MAFTRSSCDNLYAYGSLSMQSYNASVSEIHNFVLWSLSFRLVVCPYTMQPMQGDWTLSDFWLLSVTVLWMPGIQ